MASCYPPSLPPFKPVRIMNVTFRPAIPVQRLGFIVAPAECLLGPSTRVGPLRWREEHEDRQVLQNIMEPMLGSCRNEDDASRPDLAIVRAHTDPGTAANDIVDLILGVCGLLVLGAPRKFIEPATHRCDPQELEVCLAPSPARLEEISDFVSVHRMPPHRGMSPRIKSRRRTRYD